MPDKTASVTSIEIAGKKLQLSNLGKVLVDWSQNDHHKTTVCVYSLRAREHPTVSAPVRWPEVEAAAAGRGAGLLTFEAGQVVRCWQEFGELFAPVLKLKQELPSDYSR